MNADNPSKFEIKGPPTAASTVKELKQTVIAKLSDQILEADLSWLRAGDTISIEFKVNIVAEEDNA